MAKQAAKNDNSDTWEVFLIICFGIFVVGWATAFIRIPHTVGPVHKKALASYNHVIDFMHEAGKTTLNTGRIDAQFEQDLHDIIFGLQEHPVWGWEIPADGVISGLYLQHLKLKAGTYHDKDVGEKVLAFIESLEYLNKKDHIFYIGGFSISSLAFSNGIFVGWADELAIKLFHSDTEDEKKAAQHAYKKLTLYGQVYHPTLNLIFLVFGTIFSIFGAIAVFIARKQLLAEDAFKIGFFAEIGEFFLFQLGYYVSTGENGITFSEILITLAVAVLMGFVAVWLHKKYNERQRQTRRA